MKRFHSLISAVEGSCYIISESTHRELSIKANAPFRSQQCSLSSYLNHGPVAYFTALLVY